MAEQTTNPDSLRSVRGRYPGAAVYGAGQYGAITFCGKAVGVRLYETEQEARKAAEGECKVLPCLHRHDVHRFKPFDSGLVWEDRDDREWERKIGIKGL